MQALDWGQLAQSRQLCSGMICGTAAAARLATKKKSWARLAGKRTAIKIWGPSKGRQTAPKAAASAVGLEDPNAMLLVDIGRTHQMGGRGCVLQSQAVQGSGEEGGKAAEVRVAPPGKGA